MPHPLGNKPRWLKVKPPTSKEYLRLRALMRDKQLHSVCEEATCPNIGQCWHEGSAAFMILGRICTRRCAFCDVETGRPAPIDPNEPAHLAEAARALNLNHVVITSVDRDDLDDGGAAQFARCIEALRAATPQASVEVLTPDFRNKEGALEQVIAARPDVFNHNVETVPRLYADVRPVSSYAFSLAVLKRAGELDPSIKTKSGIMLGLGEEESEVLAVFDDLRAAGVTYLTVGQYLRPSESHHPVLRYWEPEAFERLERAALDRGFEKVACHPLARSSFHARELHRGDA
ncbi:lipoyl synthase [Magnetofaba australis]|uniref:Lipoyl synthase n=1 Tax=Magnetofaba australis IT-1 TaxID=1434232 RepID=A0A1Y2K2U1_9PROT|nr:lipoyl synthase [Magnetofaba australis]OSM01977.1 putative lipoyl synthase [Magnetofaba australis IT-1]